MAWVTRYGGDGDPYQVWEADPEQAAPPPDPTGTYRNSTGFLEQAMAPLPYNSEGDPITPMLSALPTNPDPVTYSSGGDPIGTQSQVANTIPWREKIAQLWDSMEGSPLEKYDALAAQGLGAYDLGTFLTESGRLTPDQLWQSGNWIAANQNLTSRPDFAGMYELAPGDPWAEFAGRNNISPLVTIGGLMGGAALAGGALSGGAGAAGLSEGTGYGIGEAFGGMATPEAVAGGAQMAAPAGGLMSAAGGASSAPVATPGIGYGLGEAYGGMAAPEAVAGGANIAAPAAATTPLMGPSFDPQPGGAMDMFGSTNTPVPDASGQTGTIFDFGGTPPAPSPTSGGTNMFGNPLSGTSNLNPTGQFPWLDTGLGLAQLAGLNNFRKDILGVMNRAIDYSDPAYGQRAGYQQQYANMQNDPNWMQNDAVLNNISQAALRNVASQNAAKGYLNSGNILHDLTRTSTETVAPYAMQRMQQVGEAGGVLGPRQNASQAISNLGGMAAMAGLQQNQTLGNMAGSIGDSGWNPGNLFNWLS